MSLPAARFSARAAQVPAAAFGTPIALLGLAGLADSAEPGVEPRVWGAPMTAFGVWFAYRGVRSATVIVNAETVTTRASQMRSSSEGRELRPAQ